MRVVIRQGESEVELDDPGAYQPSIMRDLCDNARKTWSLTFDDMDEDNVEVQIDEEQ